jgi:hypothetical protein
MFRFDQRIGCVIISNSIEESGHGRGGFRHSPKFDMFLSRSWAGKLKQTLHMDMSYDTIPVFSQERRLYREVLLKYMASRKTQPNNPLIYSVDTEVDSSIFYNDLSFEEGEPTTVMTVEDKVEHQTEESID